MSQVTATSSLLSCWTNFWFLPRQATALHIIRILFGILLLCWLAPFAGYLNDFFSLEGWFDRAAFTEGGQMIDNQSWSLLYLVAHDSTLLSAFFWLSIAVIACFTLGFFTRITSVLTWLIVISFTANPLIEVDTDVFFRIIAFYLMIGYLLLDITRQDLPDSVRAFSPWNHWIGSMLTSTEQNKSAAVTVALRLLQVHFALAMVIMGLHKLQMAEWWGGVSFWYPLHRPSQTSLESINEMRNQGPISYLFWMSLAAYAVLAWQIFFPTFAWRTGRFRWILVGGAILGTVGLMAIYSIPLLGPTFFLLCLCYLTDTEWHWVLSPLHRLVKR